MMQQLVRTLICAFALTGVWLLSTAHAQSQEEKPVLVGMILPLTGPRASIGHDALDGAKLALSKLNSKVIDLVVEDSQGDPRKGIDAYKKMRLQGIKFVISMNSNVSLPISELVNKDRIIQLAISTTSEKYSTPDDLTFRTNGTTKLEAERIGRYLIKRAQKNPAPVAVITMEDEYPLNVRDNLLETLGEARVHVKYQDTFLPQEFDFRSIITKLKQLNVKYVAFLAYQTQAGYFVKQQSELALKPELIIGNVPFNNIEFFEIAREKAEGVMAVYIDYERTHPEAKRFKAKYGRETNFCAANGYDAVIIAERAFKACSFLADVDCLKSALFSIKDYRGLSGNKSFDNKFGDMDDTYSLLVASNGKFIPYFE